MSGTILKVTITAFCVQGEGLIGAGDMEGASSGFSFFVASF
jgi:hypothetical protein